MYIFLTNVESNIGRPEEGSIQKLQAVQIAKVILGSGIGVFFYEVIKVQKDGQFSSYFLMLLLETFRFLENFNLQT